MRLCGTISDLLLWRGGHYNDVVGHIYEVVCIMLKLLTRTMSSECADTHHSFFLVFLKIRFQILFDRWMVCWGLVNNTVGLKVSFWEFFKVQTRKSSNAYCWSHIWKRSNVIDMYHFLGKWLKFTGVFFPYILDLQPQHLLFLLKIEFSCTLWNLVIIIF